MGQLKTSKINKKSVGPASLKPDLSRDIAIIGLSCQFPEAGNAEEYWSNLVAGKNSISVVSKERWDPDLYYSKDIHAAEKSVSKWGGFIDKIDLFDNQFFGISGREARAMDPQQRLLLEKTFQAIQDAGVSLHDLQKVKTSVYMGVMAIDYYKNAFSGQTDNYSTAGSSTGILANRISFAFGLEGASMTIDTACASSLCALHEGRASILSGVHEYSLVGGVTLNFQPWKYISFSKARMLSPDGQCKTFDKSANGYVPGEGVGVLLLSSLDKALERGHHIYGVVKGTAMNHTGPSQALTAPRVEAQREVIRAALKDARVGAETISYVEAHGTGTSLGDPIEIEALTQTFREDTGKVGYCGIGSVKTNIGHLEAAAGIASIVKVLMMFKHRQIPRTLNLSEVNPIIDFASSPFKLALEQSEWKPVDYPLRRAGISSFGFGGVNAHAILEEVHPDLLKERAASLPRPAIPQVLSLSSKTANGLLEEIAAWEKFLDPETLRSNFASACLTSNQSRSSFAFRAGALVDPSKPANELFAALKKSVETKNTSSASRIVITLKPLAYPDLAAFESLYRRYAPLARHFDTIEKEIKLRENKSPEHAAFSILYALGKTLSERIQPAPILTGSGIGYLAALAVAGALRPRDAARLLEKKSSKTETKTEIEGLQAASPVFDPISEKIVHPLRADAAYLKDLFNEFKITAEVFERYSRLAKPLIESQFTFKKLVGEWETLLASRNTSFESFLAGKTLRQGEQKLFVVIVKAALSRLKEKWNLTEKEKGLPLLGEWTTLASGEYLDKDFLVSLFLDENHPDAFWDKALAALNERLEANPDSSLSILRKKQSPVLKLDQGSSFAKIKLNESSLDKIPGIHKIALGGEEKISSLHQAMPQIFLDLWLSGQISDLEDLTPRGSYENVSLPPYVFERNSFWIDGSEPKTVSHAVPSLSSTAKHEPLIAKSEGLFERIYKLPQDSLVADHRIAGTLLVPGAAMLELGLRAYSLRYPNDKNLRLSNALIQNPGLATETYPVEVKIEGQLGNASFSVIGGGKVLASGRVENTALSKPKNIGAELSALSQISFDAPELYRSFARLGYEYGPALQVIKQLWERDGSVILKLSSGAALEGASQMDPALLDGMFQALIAALGESAFPAGTLFVPYSLGGLILHAPLRGDVFAKLPLASLVWQAGRREVSVDMVAYDLRGEPILTLEKMVFRQAPKVLFQKLSAVAPSAAKAAPGPVEKENASQSHPENLFFFKPHWIRKEIQASAIPADSLVIAMSDSLGLGENVLAAAKRRGLSTMTLSEGSAFSKTGDSGWTVDFKSEKHWDELAAEIKTRFGQASPKPRLLVFAPFVERGMKGFTSTSELARLNESSAFTFFYLLKAIAKKLFSFEVDVLALKPESADPKSTLGLAQGSLAGLARTAVIENKKLRARVVSVMESELKNASLGETLLQEWSDREPKDIEVSYRQGGREVRRNTETQSTLSDGRAFRSDGVYLIAGGAGGIGLRFCETLAGRVKGLVLLGRSELSADKKKTFSDLEKKGTRILYLRADLSKEDEVSRAAAEARKIFGGIHGVIHSGGNLEDGLLLSKSSESFAKVFNPKVIGAWNLHLATAGDRLDFFCVFSSIVSVIGNVGQADYASANSFLDLFAHWRNASGASGKTQSLNWTLWADGGMGHKDAVLKQLGMMGITPLPAEHAIPAFESFVLSGESQIVVVAGDHNKLSELFYSTKSNLSVPQMPAFTPSAPIPQEQTPKVMKPVSQPQNLQVLEAELKAMIAKILGNDPAKIDSARNISEYGADSVLVMELAEKLSERYGDQLHHQTILDYPTVGSLAAHIQSLGIATGTPSPSEAPSPVQSSTTTFSTPTTRTSSGGETGKSMDRSLSDQRIAVVGMAGRFPKSFNVDIFWERLRNGEDLITEVPPERFDISPWLNTNVPNHSTYTKKGGFVEGVEYFDPEFFNIKEEDARIIDPQQRIFLELVQEAMDRGGYRRRDLAGTETSVFVGAGESEYAKREKEAKYEGKNGVVNTITNLISSRVSDFYDLHGPSWTVHTACSSSLIAIHNGCQSILSGESEMAIAGGTEFLLEESFYIGFTNSKVLSPDGKCKTFDKKANGFVLGEGAGVVILKSYTKAVADGDRIFGVILASAANNDGKTMGLTTPNIHAQKKLIQTALRRGQINPETISYFEAHGTGTNLGDPIEVKAASEVYASFTKEKNFCAIGSVKSNMGHSLMASGIASFIKVLLAMKHRQIPPTLHCDEPHPGIGFGNLPFFPVTKLMDWKPQHGVRRAGISSFGFGGTNAHLIVEEADPHYKPHREVLPPTRFNRRRIWVDAKGTVKPQVFIPAAAPALPSKVIMENSPVYSSNSSSAGGGLKEVMAYLKHKVAATLKTSPDSIAETGSFLEMGLDSMTVMELTNSIQDEKKVELYPTLLFEYTTIRDLAGHLLAQYPNAFSGGTTSSPVQSPSPASVPSPATPASSGAPGNVGAVKNYLKERVAKTLQISANQVDDKSSFMEMGLDSTTVLELTNSIQDEKGIELYPTLLFEYTHLDTLAAHLLKEYPSAFSQGSSPSTPAHPTPVPASAQPVYATAAPVQPQVQSVRSSNASSGVREKDIAVIGMSGRFPKSKNLNEFWENLKAGKNLVTEVPASRWDWKKFYGNPETEPNKTNCKHGGFVDEVDQFDPLFFGISPREAIYMDPQQRLFIESVWEAIEDSGYKASSLAGRKVGLFAGVSTFDYTFQLHQDMEHVDASIGTGVAHSTLVNRISYLLDLRGPSEAVDTACSSALVALHHAIRSIWYGDAELAIAGGVNISSSPIKYITFSRAGMLSPDGQCKTFDKDANGYVPGEGVGAVLLKPLSAAIRDKDQIYGVIKGTAVNHGGHANSLTSPNPNSQADVIIEALRQAEVSADTISLVEAHGTGTKLGDPIEITGLKKAFASQTQRKNFCAVGSVKTNIGHLEAAAGIAGLIKLLLALRHKTIPATINYNAVNPYLDIANSPFVVANTTRPWETPVDSFGKTIPRRAGLSSFGFGGTNAHVIVEEYNPALHPSTEAESKPYAPVLGEIFLLSAKSETSLKSYAGVMASFVKKNASLSLSDLCRLSQLGREAFEYRLAFRAENTADLVAKLEAFGRGENFSGAFTGHIPSTQKATPLPEDIQKSFSSAQSNGSDAAYGRFLSEQLLGFWSKGANIPWDHFYSGNARTKFSIPTYPYSKKRYWITDVAGERDSKPATPLQVVKAPIAPVANKPSAPQVRVAPIAMPAKTVSPMPTPKPVAPPAKAPVAKATKTAASPGVSAIENILREKSAAVLYLQPDDIETTKPFVELGLDSILAVEIINGVNKELGIRLQATKLYDYPSIEQLAAYIDSVYGELAAQGAESESSPAPASPSTAPVNVQPISVAPVAPRPISVPKIESSPAPIPTQTPKPVAPAVPRQTFPSVDTPELAHIEESLKKEIAAVLYITTDDIEPEKSFVDIGLDSILAVEIINGVNKALGIKLQATKLYDYPNITQLASYIHDSFAELVAAVNATPAEGETPAAVPTTPAPLSSPAPVAIKPVQPTPVPVQPLIKTPSAPSKKVGDVDAIETVLKNEIAAVLYMSADEIDPEKSFVDIGLDSILAVEIINGVNKALNIKLQATKLYDYPNARALATYIAENLDEASAAPPVEVAPLTVTGSTEAVLEHPEVLVNRPAPPLASILPVQPPASQSVVKTRDIAIIGMAGQFPGGKTLDQFWTNLENGVCSVVEIPKSRWDIEAVYDPDPRKPRKTYCKHMGVVDDADEFDPLFFEISPKEAERMDPQQRLFLRSCWEVLEDAGYASREKISRKKVGVYVGVMNHDYSEVLSKSGLNHDAHEMMGNSGSILAARISYILDLKGPSMTVDTACSSSLVASHLAIQSILSGECEMAIAGGVTLYLDERLYILMSKSGMLTPNGLCKTFDNDADGFVPGEGCGAVLLKSLDKAIADGDHIHAIIRGSGLNQDGKTNGITAPSALSQTELELGIYQKYEINPETITMMEAHGTATKLGDPIEVNALTDSWRKYTSKKQFCAIGSVKSNLGHTSAAAGMAGLFKIILAMKKGKIPATLHFKKGNEHIDFQNSPFFVVDKLLEWKTPAGIPKRAGLNSFGFSGTNAHFVFEEAPKVQRTARREAPFYLAMITGRKAGNIEGMLKKMLAFLELPENAQLHPGDISMTINSGRQLFQRKIALIYTSVNDLKRQMRDLLAKAPLSETTPGPLLNLKGATKRDPAFKFQELLPGLTSRISDAALYRASIEALALAALRGENILWEPIYAGTGYKKLALPTYAFDTGKYWVQVVPKEPSKEDLPALHLLIDSNVSSLDGTRFSKKLSANSFYLRDHVIGGKNVLPGVVSLEMGRVAAELAAGKKIRVIRHLELLSPINVDASGRQVDVALVRAGSEIAFQILSKNALGREVLHARGLTALDEPSSALGGKADIAGIRARVNKKLDPNELYKSLETRGMVYGPSFRPIRDLVGNEKEALGNLSVQPELKIDFSRFLIHPALTDGALQTVAGIVETSQAGTWLPVHFGGIQIVQPLTEEVLVHSVKTSENTTEGTRTYRVEILSHQGDRLVVFEEFRLKNLSAPSGTPAPTQNASRIPNYYHPVWKEAAFSSAAPVSLTGDVLLFDDQGSRANEIKAASPNAKWISVNAGPAYAENGDSFVIRPGSDEDFAKLWDAVLVRGSKPSLFIHLWTAEGSFDLSKLEAPMAKGLGSFESIARVLLQKSLAWETRIVAFGEAHLQGVQVRPNPLSAGAAGFSRSLAVETTRIQMSSAYFDHSPSAAEVLAAVSSESKTPSVFREAFFGGGKKLEKRMSVTPVAASAKSALRESGVYLITGGVGGLGLMIAKYLAKKYRAKTLLLSRRSVAPEVLADLASFGAEAIQGDVTDPVGLKKILDAAKTKHGKIHGLIHSAGITRDALLKSKPHGDFTSVLTPKIYGGAALHAVFENENLDFILYMSSIAAVTGNTGQTDYAAGNAFLDQFAHWQNEKAGRVFAHSVNWGLWEKGGMTILPAQIEALRKTGLDLITDEEGIRALEFALSTAESPLTVFAGKEDRIRKNLRLDQGAVVAKTSVVSSGSETALANKLKALLADLLKVSEDDLDIETEVTEYGVDSLTAMMIKDMISGTLLKQDLSDELQVAAIMENPTLSALARFLLEKDMVDPAKFSVGAVAPAPALTPTVSVVPVAGENGSNAVVQAPVQVAGSERIVKALVHIVSSLLKVSFDDIDAETDITEYGVDSLTAMMIKDIISGLVLKDDMMDELQVAAIMENSNLTLLGGYLESKGFLDLEKLSRFEANGYKFEVPSPNAETSAPTLTPNAAASAPASSNGAASNGALPFARALEKKLAHFVAEVIGVREDAIRPQTNLFEIGLDEVGTQMLVDLIAGNLQSQSFTKSVYPSVVMEHSSVENLARFLIEKGVVREEEHKV